MLSKRIRAIDAARGTAMLFVFLSHFAEVYFVRSGAAALANWSYRVSMLASPTFMIISGVMLGFLYQTHRDNFGGIRAKYIARGLFLLTLGRILILIAHISISGSIVGALRWGFITDTIGVCLVLAPFLVERTKPEGRVIIAFVLYTLSTFVALLWHPQFVVFRFVKDVLFGETYGVAFHTEFFAFVPWFSLFFLGTCVGQKVATYYLEKKESEIPRFVLKVALLSLFLFALALLTSFVWIQLNVAPRFNGLFRTLAAPFAKRPPMPSFLLMYGGIGLLLLSLLFKYEDKNPLIMLYMKVAAMSGRTSMFVFILQYYVYFTFFSEANLKYTNLWPLYFIASIGFVLTAARYWDRKKFNRLFTVPYLDRLLRLQNVH